MQQQTSLGSIRRDACRVHTSDDLIVRGLGREINRKVAQTNRIRRRRRGAASLPGIESEVVMISASGDESHLERFRNAHHVEADHAVIKIYCLIHIADVEMHVSDFQLRRNGGIEAVAFLDVIEQRVHIQRFSPVAP